MKVYFIIFYPEDTISRERILNYLERFNPDYYHTSKFSLCATINVDSDEDASIIKLALNPWSLIEYKNETND